MDNKRILKRLHILKDMHEWEPLILNSLEKQINNLKFKK